MKYSNIAHVLLAAPLAAAYLVPPPGTPGPGTTQQCSKWVVYNPNLTCASIEAAYGITEAQFTSWNPVTKQVSTQCTLVSGFSYCVEINFGNAPTSSTSAPSTITTATSTTTPPQTSTSAGNGVATPTPYQAGMTTNCNSFYLVKSGDNCDSIASTAKVALADFYTWNPAVGNTCSSLWLGYYVCTGVIGGSPTSKPTSTTTQPGNGISTPTPTQANMTPNCNRFHQVASGDNCYDIAQKAGISLDNFYSWNPSVGTSCSSLWAGYYVCTGVINGTPTTMRTTTTSAGNGIATPTPIQPGMINKCKGFHQVVSGDNCYDIAAKARITLDNFYAWNPAVGNTCASLWLGYYVCIAIL